SPAAPDGFGASRGADGGGLLTARVAGALWWQRAAGPSQLDFLAERRAIASGSRFRTTSGKIMQDGVCENFTAAMLTPYLDGHGHETSNSGHSFVDGRALKEGVVALAGQGFQVHVHCIGDRGTRAALDAFAAARDAGHDPDLRHHIAHIHAVHPYDVPR